MSTLRSKDERFSDGYERDRTGKSCKPTLRDVRNLRVSCILAREKEFG